MNTSKMAMQIGVGPLLVAGAVLLLATVLPDFPV